MPTVLFVDDEPLLLGGLVRSLRVRLRDATVITAGTAEAALQQLRTSSVDIVVSDLRMAGTDGVALLDHVHEEFPSAARLLLTGDASSAASLRAVRVAHQVLTKPVDAEDLAARLSRILDSRRRWANDDLVALVAGADVLPCQNGRYAELLGEVHSEPVSMERIGEIIEGDAVLTAKVLQLANSAFCGLGRRIVHPAEAASYLGVNTMCALVASAEMRRAVTGRLAPGFPADAINSFGRRCATLVLDFASNPARHAAFTASLLQDVGLLMLGCVEPGATLDHLRRARALGCSLVDLEADTWGFTHADAGGCLLDLWDIPQPVVDAVAAHHAPRPRPAASAPLVALIAARALAGRDPHEPSSVDQAHRGRVDGSGDDVGRHELLAAVAGS